MAVLEVGRLLLPGRAPLGRGEGLREGPREVPREGDIQAQAVCGMHVDMCRVSAGLGNY